MEACTLPDQKTLETLGGFSDAEIEWISRAAPLLNPLPLEKRRVKGLEVLRQLWPDPYLYAEKTHYILDNRQDSDTFGSLVRMIPNYAQRRFLAAIKACIAAGELPRFIILKARQLGFSTFIQSMHYGLCDWHGNRQSMTISYDDDSTKEMFRKALTIRRQAWISQDAKRDTRGLIELANGSIFHTATAGKINAGRSFTVHHLHCSETPMWVAADETLTAVLQAVPKHPSTSVFLESTAKGAVGAFHDMYKMAEQGRGSFKPFFAPWFWDPTYTYPFKSTQQSKEFARAKFSTRDLRYQRCHKLTDGQMAWRHYKIVDDLQDNVLKFQQEYPAEPDEAFLSSGSPRFSAERVKALGDQVKEPVWQGDITLAKDSRDASS